MVVTEPLTAEKWGAIISNDSAYDNIFFYAVKSTGIFCRPSCKSRAPRIEHVQLFENAEQALAVNFRPCKRCRPVNRDMPDQEWVAHIIKYIEMNYTEALTLQSLADACHGSPYHLLRTFKRIKGITPVKYIQMVRINQAKAYLLQSNKSIAEIGNMAGLPNTPYFITLFKKITGFTPKEYRQKFNNITEVHSYGVQD
jgi:AraC family transcriptional regulator of adaptative response / methylphosphotriester-DNA alkyltransferase methyltransferase